MKFNSVSLPLTAVANNNHSESSDHSNIDSSANEQLAYLTNSIGGKDGQFDIRNHLDKLTPAKGKNRYECPICGGDNLTLDPSTGKYQCWNYERDKDHLAEIRESLSPWADKIKGNGKTYALPQRQSKPKLSPPKPAKIPNAPIKLARFPQPAQVITNGIGKTEYPYGNDRVMIRIDKPDGDKICFPMTGKVKGKKEQWEPYRLEEVLELGKGQWVLGAEGEKCVETARGLGIVAWTMQAADWKEDLENPNNFPLCVAAKRFRDGEIAGVVYLPDNDVAGKKKADTVALACAFAGMPCIILNPLDINPDAGKGWDIADWVGESIPSAIEGNAQSIADELKNREAVSGDRTQSDNIKTDEDDNNSVSLPDSLDLNVTFNQQAFNFLYHSDIDHPWICVEGNLYQWKATFYKHSNNGIELEKIAKFCNSFPVEIQNKDGSKSITYPYAKPSKAKEVMEWTKMMLHKPKELLNPPGLNCTNGVLQIVWVASTPKWQCVPHSPDYYYTYEPVVTYDPEADPTQCNKMLSALDAPQREIFLRTIAASLDLSTVRKFKGRLVRGLLLKGDGNNGKDTLREAVAALYGYQGTTGCTLSDFKAYDDGRKFPLARLKNSRVNWATENANTTALDKIQSIKAFLTGDTLSCEGKGKDETDYNPTAIGLFNVNDTPNMKGTLEAIASRWGILLFLKTFKEGADPAKGEIEADPRFKYDPDFLKQEVLPAFLNQVLAALPELMTTGIDYSCTQQALEDIQRENSHLFQFAQDVGLTFDPNSTVTASEIWNQLEQWYLNNGTLTYEESSSGKKAKAIWQDQPRKSDRNVKAVNQVIQRFQGLFPKAKAITIPGETRGKGRQGFLGLGFTQLPNGSPNWVNGSPNGSPKESLHSKDVHPVHPISYINEEKNETDSEELMTNNFDSMQNQNMLGGVQKLGELGELGLISNPESSNSNASDGLTPKNNRVNGSPYWVNQDDVDTEFSIDLSAIDFSDCKSVAKALQQAYAMGDGHQKTVGTIYSKASLNVKTLIDGLSSIPDDAKKYIQDCYELVKNDQSRKVK